jgi:hypothetical protein
MNLIQLVYASLSAGPIGSSEMIDILEPARANNERDSITGLLAFSGVAFLQVLEGERAIITRRFARIAADKRHRDVELIGVLYPTERRFPDWTMGFAGFKSFKLDLVQKYATSGELNGASLRPDNALALLVELARQEKRPDNAT